MIAKHILTVLRDADEEFGPDADISCPGVTEACAEWVECTSAECKAFADERTSADDFTAHGQEHRYFDEQPSGYWAVRTGFCYAENHGYAEASEFAEQEKLDAGRYAVTVEVDDSTIIITAARSSSRRRRR